ncbi:MAG: CmcJ/NvfI family oxidoreductase [Pseudomonadota bacterium]
MRQVNVETLDHVTAQMAYTQPMDGPAKVRIFPPNSGRPIESPPRERHSVEVYDCRPIAGSLTLDVAGFELLTHATAVKNFYDAEQVRRVYYPEVVELLKAATGAEGVYVFDHNVRSRIRSERKEPGVREPVDGAHNDYTLASGPRRIGEILSEHGAELRAGQRAAVINVWRPIVGPVQDHPIAICDARTTKIEDFIPTEITHYLEDDLERPSLTGEIYSFQHSPEHRWFYVSDMQPDEAILLKCFDTATDGTAIFTGHTGFVNPSAPANHTPRESIEARTVVVYPT